MKIRNIVLSLVAVLSLVFPLASKAVGETGVVQSVSVFNDTKNRDAVLQSAEKEDFLTFTLVVRNNNSYVVNNYSPSVDVNSVLNLADMVDRGGATLNNGWLYFYPAMNIPANSTVTKSFKVRVKYFLPASGVTNMSVVFGNTVNISVNRPSITMNDINPGGFNDSQVKGAYVAPKTGADMNALWFGLALALGYGVVRNRKQLLSVLVK